jgi:aspartate kinase
MKVMKFGGTSVGKPERMHQVAQLITAGDEPKIVVLSALSGTTNALVSISDSIAHSDRYSAKRKIDELEAHYRNFVLSLVKSQASLAKANAIVTEHFEFLNIILKISFSEALNKDILAQGELISTKLFCVYLEENSIDHLLLPALEFMSIDANEEPQIGSIKVQAEPAIATAYQGEFIYHAGLYLSQYKRLRWIILSEVEVIILHR